MLCSLSSSFRVPAAAFDASNTPGSSMCAIASQGVGRQHLMHDADAARRLMSAYLSYTYKPREAELFIQAWATYDHDYRFPISLLLTLTVRLVLCTQPSSPKLYLAAKEITSHFNCSRHHSLQSIGYDILPASRHPSSHPTPSSDETSTDPRQRIPTPASHVPETTASSQRKGKKVPSKRALSYFGSLTLIWDATSYQAANA